MSNIIFKERTYSLTFYTLGKEVGIVTDPEINEASGLVASQTYSNVFWTLNDSGILHKLSFLVAIQWVFP